jgi:hypothetical protein
VRDAVHPWNREFALLRLINDVAAHLEAGIRLAISPTPNQLEPGSNGFFELRSGHWEEKEMPVLIGRVAFPCLQDGANVVALNAFVYHFLASDLGKHEIGVGEGISTGGAMNPGRRFVNLKHNCRFSVLRGKG